MARKPTKKAPVRKAPAPRSKPVTGAMRLEALRLAVGVSGVQWRTESVNNALGGQYVSGLGGQTTVMRPNHDTPDNIVKAAKTFIAFLRG